MVECRHARRGYAEEDRVKKSPPNVQMRPDAYERMQAWRNKQQFKPSVVDLVSMAVIEFIAKHGEK